MPYLSPEGCKNSTVLKDKICTCFVDLEKAFDRATRKVLEWVMRKKEMPNVFVGSVMSLCEGERKQKLE